MSLEGFFKWSQKDFSDHVTLRVFQMIPERFLRSCQDGFFKLCQKHFFRSSQERFFKSCQRDFFRSCQEGFFSNYAREIFQIKSKKGGFQIMPERFFRSSEESSNKLAKSADIMCMMEQILESWVVSDHVCFVTCGFSPMFRSRVFGLCIFNGLLLIRPSEIVLQICPTFLQLSQYTTSRLISSSSSNS